MEIFNFALDILIEICEGKTTFHDATAKNCLEYQIESWDIKNVRLYVGSFLRHYYILEKITKDKYPEATQRCRFAAGIALINGVFIKRYPEVQAIEFVRQVFLKELVTFDPEEFRFYLTLKKQAGTLMPEDIDENSLEYLHYRYNLPEWLAKTWYNNYGTANVFKLAKAFNRIPKFYVFVNPLISNARSVISKNHRDFAKTNIDEDIYLYIGKQSIKTKNYLMSARFLQINLAVNELVDRLPIDELKPVVIYSGTYNIIPLLIGLKYKNKIKVESLVEPRTDYYIFKSNTIRFELTSTRTSECSPEQFVTAVSNKVPLFIVAPNSSCLEKMRYSPDYFLSFDTENLDDLIENEYKSLEEASNFIEDNGHLAYFVNTLNKKEGERIVSRFLTKHGDFELVFDVQHFPCDTTDTMAYFAILRKKPTDE